MPPGLFSHKKHEPGQGEHHTMDAWREIIRRAMERFWLATHDNARLGFLRASIDTLARVGEINRLTWTGLDFKGNYLALSTRRKRGATSPPAKGL